MNRDFLKSLGIEDEQVDKIMAEHGKSVTKVKTELTDAQGELESLKTQISDRDQQLEELSKKVKGDEELTKQIEDMKKENERKLKEAMADALKAKKESLLIKAGYTDEQVKVLSATISGETDEELAKSIEDLKAVITPKPAYVDPSLMNGQRGNPGQKDDSDIGRNLFEKLKAKGKIR